MNISMVIGDIVRWLVGLIVMTFALGAVFIGLLYLFEIIARYLDSRSTLIYLIGWGFSFLFIIPLLRSLATLLLRLATKIIRQDLIFTILVSVLMFLGLIAFLIMFWVNYIGFSWELLEFSTLNKWMFSFYLISMLGIATDLFVSIEDEMIKKYGTKI